MPLLDAVVNSCRIRLRPILMTSLATIFGLVPMALKLGTGSEAYAPLARAIIGGLIVSVLLTVFIVPAAYLIVYRRRPRPAPGEAPDESAPRWRLRPVPARRASSTSLRAGAAARSRSARPSSARSPVIPQVQAAQFGGAGGQRGRAGGPVRATGRRIFGSVTGARRARWQRGLPPASLNNPSIFDRFATGVTVDAARDRFRTHRRSGADAALRANAQEQDVTLVRAERVCSTSIARTSTRCARRRSQRVAQQTVDARQLVVDQVDALARAA